VEINLAASEIDEKELSVIFLMGLLETSFLLYGTFSTLLSLPYTNVQLLFFVY